MPSTPYAGVPPLPPQVAALQTNVNKIIERIYKLKEKTFLTPSIPKLDIEPHLMTERQIAKKIILVTSGAATASGQILSQELNQTQNIVGKANSLGANINTQPINKASYDAAFAVNAATMLNQVITPETAHLIVYGKIKRGADGAIVDNEVEDPDCVGSLGMPANHPTLADIRDIKNQLIKAIKMLGIKQQDLIDDIAEAMISIPASISAMVSAVAILPPGSGLPVAFAAFQTLISTIMTLVQKVVPIPDYLHYMDKLPILLKPEMLDAILGTLNVGLTAILTILDTIDAVAKLIPSTSALSSMTGGSPMPPPTYVTGDVTGSVSAHGPLLANVTVTIGDKSSTTDESGNYTIEKIKTGDYEIKAVPPPGIPIYSTFTGQISVQEGTINYDITLDWMP